MLPGHPNGEDRRTSSAMLAAPVYPVSTRSGDKYLRSLEALDSAVSTHEMKCLKRVGIKEIDRDGLDYSAPGRRNMSQRTFQEHLLELNSMVYAVAAVLPWNWCARKTTNKQVTFSEREIVCSTTKSMGFRYFSSKLCWFYSISLFRLKKKTQWQLGNQNNIQGRTWRCHKIFREVRG